MPSLPLPRPGEAASVRIVGRVKVGDDGDAYLTYERRIAGSRAW